ncbi:RAQPRD family integrative conjugative element protein [Thioalkalivibrio sp. ALE20]|uniref:integrative conjugative element protein, RAQPRD family n=1 Tax=Thioalkalivibrio sp. ALE20 TaxID=545275 RepID=UPI000571D4FC|nr:RAQPRD family integrative conjugative element protein [Thioalkalivibrio sp. ALE20]
MPKPLVLTAIAAALAMTPVTALADRDAEREVLSRLLHEIQALDALVTEAEAHANPDERVRFEYDWLRHDLDRVKSGIREHLREPQTAPRRVEPLTGDYRR